MSDWITFGYSEENRIVENLSLKIFCRDRIVLVWGDEEKEDNQIIMYN